MPLSFLVALPKPAMKANSRPVTRARLPLLRGLVSAKFSFHTQHTVRFAIFETDAIIWARAAPVITWLYHHILDMGFCGLISDMVIHADPNVQYTPCRLLHKRSGSSIPYSNHTVYLAHPWHNAECLRTHRHAPETEAKTVLRLTYYICRYE